MRREGNKLLTGEVWMVDLDPVRGSEQGRRRPGIIFQNPSLAEFTRTRLVIPVTSNMNLRGLVGTCFLAAGQGGLAKDSVALAFQCRAIDRSRLLRRLGKLDGESLVAVAASIQSAFGIKGAA